MAEVLSERDDATGKYTIYASRGGAVLLKGTADWAEFMRLSEGIRDAERIAAKHAVDSLADAVMRVVEKRQSEL